MKRDGEEWRSKGREERKQILHREVVSEKENNRKMKRGRGGTERLQMLMINEEKEAGERNSVN